ncbi:MAG: RNA methyltransferase [Lewinellaceae bacterium]|nr:RNA methyltransferase [Lewinellaceae bacterium]
MLSAGQTKFLTALQVKKYRQKYRNFTVEGTKLVAELLDQTRIRVTAIYALERWAAENAALLAPVQHLYHPASEADLHKISALTTPQGVLAVAEMPPQAPAAWDTGHAFFLDGIRDPGNLGTILRIADWFGFSAVFCSPDCAEAFSPKVVQASMGAIFRVPVFEMELDDVLALAPACPVLGAVLNGENAFEAGWPANALLVVGSEGSGIRPETEARLTRRLTIPRAPGSHAESLNASVAAGILAGLASKNSTGHSEGQKNTP